MAHAPGDISEREGVVSKVVIVWKQDLTGFKKDSATVVQQYDKLKDKTKGMVSVQDKYKDGVLQSRKETTLYAHQLGDADKAQQQFIRSTHFMNISILSVNMSHLATGVVMAYSYAQREANIQMSRFYTLAGAVGFLLMGLTTQSREARAVLFGLAAAFAFLGSKAWFAAGAKVAAMFAEGPLGWALATATIGMIAAAITYMASIAAEGKFWKGGIITKPTRGVIGEAGPEAVIPLGSARAKNLGLSPTAGRDVYIDRANFFVRSEKPSRFLTDTRRALKRRAFLT
jgi:hypothetical protein